MAHSIDFSSRPPKKLVGQWSNIEGLIEAIRLVHQHFELNAVNSQYELVVSPTKEGMSALYIVADRLTAAEAAKAVVQSSPKADKLHGNND